MNSTFLQERITATEALIVAYETAIAFLIANPTETYRLDTGQTVQSVTRHNIEDLRKGLEGYLNLLTIYEARLNGSGKAIALPVY